MGQIFFTVIPLNLVTMYKLLAAKLNNNNNNNNNQPRLIIPDTTNAESVVLAIGISAQRIQVVIQVPIPNVVGSVLRRRPPMTVGTFVDVRPGKVTITTWQSRKTATIVF